MNTLDPTLPLKTRILNQWTTAYADWETGILPSPSMDDLVSYALTEANLLQITEDQATFLADLLDEWTSTGETTLEEDVDFLLRQIFLLTATPTPLYCEHETHHQSPDGSHTSTQCARVATNSFIHDGIRWHLCDQHAPA